MSKSIFNVNVSRDSKIRKILLLCCLCFFFLLLNVSSLLFPLRESLTYDESLYWDSGISVMLGESSKRGTNAISQRNIMPASALNLIFSKAARLVIPEDIIAEPTKQENIIYFGKLGTIFAALLLAIYVFLWGHQLYGIHAGFLAISLYILDPNIIAHARVVHQDMFGTCGIFIATYYFWNYLKFGGRRNAILSMITFGIAQLCRYTAVYLLPIFFLLTLGFYGSNLIKLFQKRNLKIIASGFKQFFIYTILLSITTALIINIGFAFDKTLTKVGDYQFESKTFQSLQSSSSLVRELPIPLPYAYVRGLDYGKYKQDSSLPTNGPAYRMGQLGLEDGKLKGFKDYFLITCLYKVPIATQLFLVMALISLIRYRQNSKFWQNEAFLIVPILFFFISFSLSNAQIGIRYILMILPFLFVFASKAVKDWTIIKSRYRIFVIFLVTYLFFSNLSYFPHYLSYFNELLIDRKMAYTILADSNLDWGQNRNYLGQYLETHPNATYLYSGYAGGYEHNQYLEKKHSNVIYMDTEYSRETRKLQQFQGDSVIVSANQLLGITANPNHFKWLRESKKPIEHVAYSYLVFEVKPQEIFNLLEINNL